MSPPPELPADRRLRLIVLAVFLAPAPTYVLTGYSGGGGASAPAWLVLPAAAAIGVIHERHARAAAADRRPAGWPVTAAALLVLVYAPLPAWSFNWASSQWFVVASVWWLAPRRAAAVAAAVLAVATGAWSATYTGWAAGGVPLGGFVYWGGALALGGGAMIGVVALGRVRAELAAARRALADAAADDERVRIGRELHDVLGQRLTAVSLTADLAIRLASRDRAAGDAQLARLVEQASTARDDVATVAAGERRVDLDEELDAAVALLRLAGTTVTVDRGTTVGPDAIEALDRARVAPLAWAVREAGTNVLRHAEASTVEVRLRHTGDAIELTVTNDGAPARREEPVRTGDGAGLAGLAARAERVGGHVDVAHRGERFQLRCRVPATRTPSPSSTATVEPAP